MKAKWGWLAVGLALGAAPSGAALYRSTEGEFRVLVRDLSWQPDCTSVFYRREPSDFAACVEKQAKADVDYAVEAIIEGRKKAYADYRRGF